CLQTSARSLTAPVLWRFDFPGKNRFMVPIRVQSRRSKLTMNHRPRPLPSRFGFIILLLLGLLVGSPLRAGDWPQFLGPTRNGVAAETNLSVSWPKEGPPIVWQQKVGQGFSGPAV